MKKQYNLIKYVKDCLFNTIGGAYFRLFFKLTIIGIIFTNVYAAGTHFQETNPVLFNNVMDVIFLTIAIIIGTFSIFGTSYNIYQNYKRHEKQYYEK